jgi:CheY-like chemotaxis protein
MYSTQSINYNILLADDDEDDCLFFKDALEELVLTTSLNTVSNGVELMSFLENNLSNLPHVLFLDLNMPRKTGFDCLTEIRKHDKLTHLSVIVFSTSYNLDVVDLLYANGAHHYIRKPADFSNFKSVVQKALTMCKINNNLQPSKEKFVIVP